MGPLCLLPNTALPSCIGEHNSYVFLVVDTEEWTAPGRAVSNSLICKNLFGAVQTALLS